MTQPFLVSAASDIHEAGIAAVVTCLRSSRRGIGPRVVRFEADCGACNRSPRSRVAALNSCTAALHVSLMAAGIEGRAHAIETDYHGKKAGTFVNFGCFGVNGTTRVNTGDGGMLQDLHASRALGRRQYTQ